MYIDQQHDPDMQIGRVYPGQGGQTYKPWHWDSKSTRGQSGTYVYKGTAFRVRAHSNKRGVTVLDNRTSVNIHHRIDSFVFTMDNFEQSYKSLRDAVDAACDKILSKRRITDPVAVEVDEFIRNLPKPYNDDFWNKRFGHGGTVSVPNEIHNFPSITVN